MRVGWGVAAACLLPAVWLVAAALASPTITEYPTGNGPTDATLGPDGNVWFVEPAANKIGRVSATGVLAEFSSGLSSNAGLGGIGAGPDGNLWFTENNANKIGRITPGGVITQFSTGGGTGPVGITAGADGNLWFTETAGGKIGRITTAGSVTQFSAGITGGRTPWGITAGPDGNLWFTERNGTGWIGRITTAGVVTEFGPTSGLPTSIATGPDGNLWVAEAANPGHIARVTPTGTITEFSAGLTHDGGPTDIVAGADGNLHFTEANGPGELGQITPAGAITEFTAGLSSAPYGISVGADGNVWFTEDNGDRIGRLTIAPDALTNAPLATSASNATLAGSITPNSQATTYHFEWGTTTAYGTSTTTASAGSGPTAQQVSAAIGGLTSLTIYHYRVVATNASGTTLGQDQVFTAQSSPIVVTGAASSLGPLTATLNATIDPNSQPTSYHFEWGSSTSYGSRLPLMDVAVGSDSTNHLVSQDLVGLTGGATYHFRVVATNGTDTSVGLDQTLTTPLPPPGTVTGAASGIDQTSATLAATIDPNGAATTYHFDVGATTDYGSQSPASDASVPDPVGQQTLTQTITGLAPDTLYHYRVSATSPFGTTYGTDQTFSTPPPASTPTPPPVVPVPPANPPGAGSQLPPATRPVFGVSATLVAASGSVRVKLPHASAYVSLSAASTVPLGSAIDTTKGTVALTSVRDRSGALQHGTFWGGSFVVRQGRGTDTRTVLTLAGTLVCRNTRRTTYGARPTPKPLRLWGRDNHGRFETRGRSAVATVRGTAWVVRDTCQGTRVSVSRGTVSVRDLVRHRTVLVAAGHWYLAHAR